MKINYSYNRTQLDMVVNYLALHHSKFKNQHSFIKSTAIELMNKLLEEFPECNSYSTMGMLVTASIEDVERTMDGNENRIYFEFYADLLVSSSDYSTEDEFVNDVFDNKK